MPNVPVLGSSCRSRQMSNSSVVVYLSYILGGTKARNIQNWGKHLFILNPALASFRDVLTNILWVSRIHILMNDI